MSPCSFHSGQMCTASSRIFVQAGVYDEFLKEYKRVSQIGQRGDAFDADTTRGPVVSEVQFKVRLSCLVRGSSC